MDNFTATMIAEGAQEPDDTEQYIEAWQHLIDTGLAWTLQGSFGRGAKSMILGGHCHERQSNSERTGFDNGSQ